MEDSESKLPSNDGNTIKKKRGGQKLIVKRTSKKGKKSKIKSCKAAISVPKRAGLPSFRQRLSGVEQTEATFDREEEDGWVLPSDTLLAIQSLQASSQGLHIPLLGNSNTTSQAILESQIFQRFEESHASTIQAELLDLVSTNQIQKLRTNRIVNATSNNPAYILTSDYVAGVWDAYHEYCQDPPPPPQQEYQVPLHGNEKSIVSYFLNNLKHWRGSSISKASMQEYWKEDEVIRTTKEDDNTDASKHTAPTQQLRGLCCPLDGALQLLMQLKVLMRDVSISDNNQEFYYLWLPQWGLVLKGWNEARQKLLTYVTRLREVSERNVLGHNRHSCVTTKFLLDELVFQGKLKIVQRPFGKFVQKVT